MGPIFNYINKMLPFMLVALPVLVMIRAVVCLARKKRVNLLHEAGIIALGLYLVGLASQAIIPKFVFSGGRIAIVDGGIDYSRINLIPFNKIPETWHTAVVGGQINYLIIEVLGNIGIFMTIGFMLPLLWKKFERLRSTVLVCFLISLTIELIQLFLPRATDVDDLIMNVLGGLVGYFIYRVFSMVLPGWTRKFKADPV